MITAATRRSVTSTVLHVITSTDRRGAETFAVQLHVALMARGWTSNIRSLVSGDGAEPLDVTPLGRRSLGPRTIAGLRAAAGTASVVIAHGSRTLPACAVGLAGSGVPFIYRSIGNQTDWAKTWSRRSRVGIFLRRAEAVVALWPSAAENLVGTYRLDRGRVHVIPNGVSAPGFQPVDRARRDAARTHFGLDPAATVALYLGALAPEKGVSVAIAAIGHLPDALLLVVGAGSERGHLESLAAEIAPRQVRFVGPVQDPGTAFATADVVVLPSWSEGMPAVAIEAGLSGLPVVASDVGGVSQVIVDGETGLLVAPGDALALAGGINKASKDSGSLSQAARSRCLKRFEIGAVASEWATLLEDVGGPGSA